MGDLCKVNGVNTLKNKSTKRIMLTERGGSSEKPVNRFKFNKIRSKQNLQTSFRVKNFRVETQKSPEASEGLKEEFSSWE
jgi:hypothetical protein